MSSGKRSPQQYPALRNLTVRDRPVLKPRPGLTKIKLDRHGIQLD